MKVKFEIGQKVKVISDGEVGEIVSMSMNSEDIFYQIASQEVDMKKRELIKGIKTLRQEELEAVEEENQDD